ncbi:hypothetical protein F441_09786, partial [Phytophthora nicotianae CJ01A1]
MNPLLSIIRLRHCVSSTEVYDYSRKARARTYTPVFREVGGASDNPFRSQSRVVRMTSTLRIVAKAIQEDASVRGE